MCYTSWIYTVLYVIYLKTRGKNNKNLFYCCLQEVISLPILCILFHDWPSNIWGEGSSVLISNTLFKIFLSSKRDLNVLSKSIILWKNILQNNKFSLFIFAFYHFYSTFHRCGNMNFIVTFPLTVTIVMDWVCAPKFIYWNHNAQCDSIWSWSLWEVMRTLMMGLAPL